MFPYRGAVVPFLPVEVAQSIKTRLSPPGVSLGVWQKSQLESGSGNMGVGRGQTGGRRAPGAEARRRKREH